MASVETADPEPVKYFTREEVALKGKRKGDEEDGPWRERTGDDAPVWLIIHDGVYDVTKFLNEHPGGEELLIEQSGQDATDAFEDIGHSSDARKMMEPFKIGVLHESERVNPKDKEDKNIASSSENNRKKGKSKSWFSFFRK